MTLFEEFVAWVEAQPKRKRYHFADHKKCALAQFAADHFKMPYISAGVFSISVGETAVTSKFIWMNVPRPNKFSFALMHSTTFGQLAKALKEIVNASHI